MIKETVEFSASYLQGNDDWPTAMLLLPDLRVNWIPENSSSWLADWSADSLYSILQ